jgi:GxxExxY protein
LDFCNLQKIACNSCILAERDVEVKKDPNTMRQLTNDIVDSALTVHRALGPGLLESAYEACLAYELEARGWKVERQKDMPVIYKAVDIDCGYRLDMLIEGEVPIELKSVEEIHPIYKAQILSYLRLGNFSLGYLMNFNVKLIKDGIYRFKM